MDIEHLFIFLLKSQFFNTVQNKLRQQQPVDFCSLESLLQEVNYSHKYLCFLVEIASFVEAKLTSMKSCYIFQQLQISNHKSWPLNIMKKSLKATICNQTASIIKIDFKNHPLARY
jgi:hypothetical protein